MRINSGVYKGRKINAPNNLPVRPTTDRAKEGLFNMLSNIFSFQNIEVLDLFTGTGNIAYEFSSRGCKEIIAVDQHIGCIRFIKSTIATLHISNIQLIRSEVIKYLSNCTRTYDVIFADPPYNMNDKEILHQLITTRKLVKNGGYFILEHNRGEDYSGLSGFNECRNYGDVNFSIFIL